MTIAGFDPKWSTFPDYIIGITKEIWEGRDIASLREYYAQDIIVRMPSGISVGNQSVIAGTMATRAEFPDRQLLADDVIWSGTPEAGLLSSHRISCTATHLHNGVFGRATAARCRSAQSPIIMPTTTSSTMNGLSGIKGRFASN